MTVPGCPPRSGCPDPLIRSGCSGVSVRWKRGPAVGAHIDTTLADMAGGERPSQSNCQGVAYAIYWLPTSGKLPEAAAAGTKQVLDRRILVDSHR